MVEVHVPVTAIGAGTLRPFPVDVDGEDEDREVHQSATRPEQSVVHADRVGIVQALVPRPLRALRAVRRPVGPALLIGDAAFERSTGSTLVASRSLVPSGHGMTVGADVSVNKGIRMHSRC
jgi:hypothetical protein